MPRYEILIPEVQYTRKVVETRNMEAAIHLARYGSGDYDAEYTRWLNLRDGEPTAHKFKPEEWVQVTTDDDKQIWIREVELYRLI